MRIASKGIRILKWRCLLPGMMLVFLLPVLNSRAAGQTAMLRILQVSPAQLSQGSSATLTITGSGFTEGCYVSFSSPVVRVISTKFRSESRLEANVKVGEMAATGPVMLFVANAEGLSAQMAFTIVAAGSVSGSAAAPAGPVISSVEPQSAAPGSTVTVKVTGRNFEKGASVSFSNPDIQVLETDVSKTTELSAKLRIAPNAAVGSGGLFVVNPDENEAEDYFSVTTGPGSSTTASTGVNGKSGATPASTGTFSVINLGDAISILQKSGKPQGTLILSGNRLEYDEQDKKVFSVALADVKEVAGNVFFGINTGTFHVILNSGKTYNFIAASLNPQATQAIVDSLQSAVH